MFLSSIAGLRFHLQTSHTNTTVNVDLFDHQTYQDKPLPIQSSLLARCLAKGCTELTFPLPLSWDRNGRCLHSVDHRLLLVQNSVNVLKPKTSELAIQNPGY